MNIHAKILWALSWLSEAFDHRNEKSVLPVVVVVEGVLQKVVVVEGVLQKVVVVVEEEVAAVVVAQASAWISTFTQL